jgi:hypothetical protein
MHFNQSRAFKNQGKFVLKKIVGWARLHVPTRAFTYRTAWAERVLLGIYPLTATAYPLRVQKRAHPSFVDFKHNY